MNEGNALPGNYGSPQHNSTGGTVGGLIVIAIGLVFLAGNFGIHLSFFAWHNWWALFILIGAAGPLGHALQRYRNIGSVDAEVAHTLLSAAVMIVVALMFLLDLSFGRWWPLFMIFGGLWMMVSNRFVLNGRGKGRCEG